MKFRFFVLLLVSALSARAQNAAPAPAAATPAATPAVASTPAAAPTLANVPVDPAVPVYPTNATMIAATTKFGILNLTAAEVPRYTQTGPITETNRRGVIPPVPPDPKLPTIWTIGDSTVRTGVNGTGDDQIGQWGWGAPLVAYFDPKKVNVVNRAVGGTTSKSFYLAQWKGMVDLIKPGDVVILQFGTNSGGGELRGIGEETQPATGRGAVAGGLDHTFGWYIRQFIAETRAKGATPVICSLIPRNGRSATTGKYARNATTQAGWAKDVAAAEGADFIDLNELVARKYDTMDKETVDALFAGGPHTSWTGAVVNAETVISGLKALKKDPAAAYYVEQVKLIAPAPDLSVAAPEPAPTGAAPATPAALPASPAASTPAASAPAK